ncbi:unnamed protein product [Darwinula stevensoni]|uniref:Ig-like domain-containing protein n=1 Tax=Darwinula stevensoni TaxID=69355 RepID=A0A7R9A107_9CRUS|nr:unnamed protein product [Darwinula stevensoni]CAG0885603.1 unnamed protein product [Darwinula stevensoni]
MTCGYPMAALLALFVIFPFATSIIQSPPRMVKQPSTEELLFQVVQRQDENNKPFIVECEAEGEPAPKYRWIKNGKHFDWQTYDNRISQQPGRGTLVVTVPQDEDRGYYQCFATNEWGTAMSNSVHVYKSDLNSFREDPPKEIEIQEGEPLSLKCSPPDGYPKPQVYWMIQSTSGALRSINSSRMTVDPEGTLWFSNVTRFDATNDFVYACSATSLFRNEYKLGNKVYLNVVAAGSAPGQSKHSPVKQYVSRKNFVAYRGKKAELWCIYGGTPLPEITWQKRGGPLPYGRFTTTNYGKTLVFKYVDYEDEGTYECFASNGVGTAQSYSISLHVEAKPEFTVEPQTVNAAEGETVEFRCESHGVPSPIIDWYHNGKPISEAPQNPRRQVMPNKVIIRNLEKTDTGNYACNASNSIGYVFKDAYVNVLGLSTFLLPPLRKCIALVLPSSCDSRRGDRAFLRLFAMPCELLLRRHASSAFQTEGKRRPRRKWPVDGLPKPEWASAVAAMTIG